MDKPFFLHQHFNDFDDFSDNVRNWNLDFRQIESGCFSSELLMFGNNSSMLTHAKIGRKVTQEGSTPPGMITFGIMSDPTINMHWRNINIYGDMMFVFPESGELSAISNGDFDFFIISLDEDKLNKTCNSLQLPDVRTLINNNEVFHCHPQKLTEIRSWFFSIKHELTSITASIIYTGYLDYIEQELTDTLIRILLENKQPVAMKPFRKRDLALLSANNYISETGMETITVPELCAATDVSKRTLEYAFRERYGLTPKSYLMIYRMNNARKQLRKANSKYNRVTEIARQHGFWHMGKFSADYKRLFGELPSETLKHYH